MLDTVEELIHIYHLKQDYFNFIESHTVLLGERTRCKLPHWGPVREMKVDMEAREVDFLLVEFLIAKTELTKREEANALMKKFFQRTKSERSRDKH